MKPWQLNLAAFTLVFLSGSAAAFNSELSPKMGVRITSGVLQNLGTIGGSSLDTAGLNLTFQYFLHRRISVGLGYKASYDFRRGNLPISGLQLPLRLYLSNTGTQSRREEQLFAVEGRPLLAWYGGAQLGFNSYYLGGSAAASANPYQSGSYQNLDALAGVELRLSRHFDLNLEGSYGAFSFAASDSRYRLRSIQGLAGLVYVW